MGSEGWRPRPHGEKGPPEPISWGALAFPVFLDNFNRVWRTTRLCHSPGGLDQARSSSPVRPGHSSNVRPLGGLQTRRPVLTGPRSLAWPSLQQHPPLRSRRGRRGHRPLGTQDTGHGGRRAPAGRGQRSPGRPSSRLPEVGAGQPSTGSGPLLGACDAGPWGQARPGLSLMGDGH